MKNTSILAACLLAGCAVNTPSAEECSSDRISYKLQGICEGQAGEAAVIVSLNEQRINNADLASLLDIRSNKIPARVVIMADTHMLNSLLASEAVSFIEMAQRAERPLPPIATDME